MSEIVYPMLARSAIETNSTGTLDGDDYTWDDDGFDGVDVREWPERMKDAIAALQDEIEQLWDVVRKQGEAIAALEAKLESGLMSALVALVAQPVQDLDALRAEVAAIKAMAMRNEGEL